MNNPTLANWDEADHEYGWKYGCDGLMGINYACQIMNLSSEKIHELIAERKLRTRESDPGADRYKVLICKRSVMEYARNTKR